MTPDPRAVIETCIDQHGRDFSCEETYYGCRCGFKRTSLVNEGTYRRHLADAVLAALEAAGITLRYTEQEGSSGRQGSNDMHPMPDNL